MSDTFTVEEVERTESGVVRRPGAAAGAAGLVDSLEGLRTVQQVLERSAVRFGDLPCIGTRSAGDDGGAHTGPFVWTTYREFAVRVGNFGRGLLHHFPPPPRQQTEEEEAATATAATAGKEKEEAKEESNERLVGLYSVNRAEWAIADMACVSYGLVGVPLYDTLGPTAVADIVRETQLPCAVCSRDKTGKLLRIAAEEHQQQQQQQVLRLIVQMEDVTAEDRASWGISALPPGVQVMSFADVERDGVLQQQKKKQGEGEEDPAETTTTTTTTAFEGRVERRPEDLHTIIYTSGTSSGAKGVLLKNGAFMAGIGGTVGHLRGFLKEGEESILSFLPLAHVLERQVFVIALFFGARTGYFGGHIGGLMGDLGALRPTVFFSVPRLFNRVYDGFQAKLRQKPLALRAVFRAAFAWKASGVGGRQQRSFTSAVDFAFGQLRAGLGGRVKLIITGSAPLAPEIHRFMQVCFACPVLQGYGMTEGYPVSVTGLEDAEPLHCGPLMAHCEMKLRDVPELGYSVRDRPFPRGEALLRGPHLFSGYFRRPDVTAEAMTRDGWYCTGDVVELLDGDRIRVIGRVKGVIKLAQGEFVVLEDAENMYGLAPLVSQVFVYGDGLRECLVAVVVPERRLLLDWWRTKLGGSSSSTSSTGSEPAASGGNEDEEEEEFRRACQDPRAAEFVLRMMEKQHAESGMSGIMRVRAVHLDPEPFSVETGVVTPTTKLAREGARRHYAAVIERLYSSISSRSPQSPSS